MKQNQRYRESKSTLDSNGKLGTIVVLKGKSADDIGPCAEYLNTA